METSIFFFSQPAAGLTNRVLVWDSQANTPLCGDKDNIVAHFAALQTMQEDLAAMGQRLEDNDFYTIIMGSLPGSYDPYISADLCHHFPTCQN